MGDLVMSAELLRCAAEHRILTGGAVGAVIRPLHEPAVGAGLVGLEIGRHEAMGKRAL